MISTATGYIRESAIAFGEAWNEFWLRPSSARPLAALRIGVGVLLLYWFVTFAPDLTTLFSADGLLPSGSVDQWEQTGWGSTEAQQQLAFGDAYRRAQATSENMSVLALCDAPVELWTAWGVGVLAAILLIAGCFSRISAWIAWAMFLSFVNRAPMLSGPFEAVAAMLLFYLALAPCGLVCSFDRWRALRKPRTTIEAAEFNSVCHAPPRWSATVTLRLIQVHLCAIYVLMALAQWGGGGGETPWATGEAIWLLAARPSSGLGFGWLASAPVLVDLWTHGMWLFTFTFPLLIWAKRARPALIVLAGVVWFAFALLTGMYAFCLLMTVAGLAFWPFAAKQTAEAEI